MTDKFEQLKKKADDIRMTESEKSLMRSRIEETMQHFPIREPLTAAQPVKSPFNFMALARSVALVLVGFIGGGGGLAFASEQALPGDILYPVKTEVTEEVVAAFKTTPEAKIEWEEERIKRRATELAKLQTKGKLEERRAQIATRKIEQARANVDTQVVRLSEDLSFDGVVFTPEVTITEENLNQTSFIPGFDKRRGMVVEENVRNISDRVAPNTTLEEEAPAIDAVHTSLIPGFDKRRGMVVEENVISLPADIETRPLPEPEPEIMTIAEPTTSIINQNDFALEVLKRMTLEIDKLETGKKIDNQTASTLDSLLEKANKLYENKEIKEFYGTIREIKEILQKILKNS